MDMDVSANTKLCETAFVIVKLRSTDNMTFENSDEGVKALRTPEFDQVVVIGINKMISDEELMKVLQWKPFAKTKLLKRHSTLNNILWSYEEKQHQTFLTMLRKSRTRSRETIRRAKALKEDEGIGTFRSDYLMSRLLWRILLIKILQDFVLDMCYSDITLDKEEPQLIHVIIMDILAEISKKAQDINLIDMLTRLVLDYYLLDKKSSFLHIFYEQTPLNPDDDDGINENTSLVNTTSDQQPQCRICLDTEGEDLIAHCHCRGLQIYGDELHEMFGYEEHPYGLYTMPVLVIVLKTGTIASSGTSGRDIILDMGGNDATN
ncbi:E3 ubiquitin protein ligase MARCH8 isoform X2 [Tanacetum coccineum]